MIRNTMLCLTMLSAVAAICGCGGAKAEQDEAGGAPPSAPAGWSVADVEGRPYQQTLDLDAAKVHGFERTPILAKVGGYVKEIKRVGRRPEKGRTVEFRYPNGGGVALIVRRQQNGQWAKQEFIGADLGELRARFANQNSELASRFDRWVAQSEVDIGTWVPAGTVLAVLDVPEMLDERNQKVALIQEAKSRVNQAVAAQTQAAELKTSRLKEVEQAKAAKREKAALREAKRKRFLRIEALHKNGGVGKELLEEEDLAYTAAVEAHKSAEAAVATAEAHASAAEAGIKKAKADYEAALASQTVAEAGLSRVETLIRYSRIKAPFSGVITQRHIDKGEFVRPATNNSSATSLFEITRTDKVRVVVSVPNNDAALVRVGQQAELHSIGGLPGLSFTSSISRTAGALDARSHMLPVEIDFDNPLTTPTGNVMLYPGNYASVRIVTKSWKNLPVVPTAALVTSNGRSHVMLLVDGAARQHNVQVVFNDGKFVGVLGLERQLDVGYRVILGEVAKLTDGAKIQTRP